MQNSICIEICTLLECYAALFLDCLTHETGPTGCPETSVTNYQSILHNIQEERGSH